MLLWDPDAGENELSLLPIACVGHQPTFPWFTTRLARASQKEILRLRFVCILMRSRCDNQGLKDRGCKGALVQLPGASIVRVGACEATTLLKALVAFKESASPEEPHASRMRASCLSKFFPFFCCRSEAFALGLPVAFAASTGRTMTAARRGSAL